jgi:hypothetical protein
MKIDNPLINSFIRDMTDISTVDDDGKVRNTIEILMADNGREFYAVENDFHRCRNRISADNFPTKRAVRKAIKDGKVEWERWERW